MTEFTVGPGWTAQVEEHPVSQGTMTVTSVDHQDGTVTVEVNSPKYHGAALLNSKAKRFIDAMAQQYAFDMMVFGEAQEPVVHQTPDYARCLLAWIGASWSLS